MRRTGYELMRFRDNQSWGLWISTMIVVPLCCYFIRCCCLQIANEPTNIISKYVVILAILFVNQAFIGTSMWRLMDTQSEYRIDETGFRSRKYALKIWHQATWGELPYCGVFRRWGIKRYIYFSNYPFDGKRMQGPINDAASKKILFIIPFSKKGWEGIDSFAPDAQKSELKHYRI